MTESTKPESPPAEGATTTQTVEESTLSTSAGTGALRSEVVAMRDTLSDRIEQLSIDVARMGQALKESQKLNKSIAEENTAIREKLESINDRQTAADQKLGESKQIGDVIATLIEAKLPVPSLVRLAASYRAGQDLHAAITAEREYLKKVIRESERGELSRNTTESSGLGLIESAMAPNFDNSASTEDISEIEDALFGKGW